MPTTYEPVVPAHDKNHATNGKDGGHPEPQHPNYSTVFHFLDEAAHHLAFSKIKTHSFYPRFDVEETETYYELFGEIPGCKKEDIHIHDVHGYGIEIEGLTLRFPHRDETSSENAKVAETKKQDDAESSQGDKTVWPDMAEPGMAAAAEEQAATTEALATTVPPTSSEPAVVQPAKPHEKHHERHGSGFGVMKTPKPVYPHTLFHERLVGNFRRTIRFPDPVDTTKVEADLKDGILRVRVPKDLAKIAEIEKEKTRLEIAWADASMWGI